MGGAACVSLVAAVTGRPGRLGQTWPLIGRRVHSSSRGVAGKPESAATTGDSHVVPGAAPLSCWRRRARRVLCRDKAVAQARGDAHPLPQAVSWVKVSSSLMGKCIYLFISSNDTSTLYLGVRCVRIALWARQLMACLTGAESPFWARVIHGP